MAPFEFLYGRPCQTPLSWDRLEDRVLVGPEAIQEMEEKMQTIRKIIKEAKDRQKSYADAHCVDRSYEFKAYKLFDLSTHKVFASRDVLFHEQEVGNHDNNSHEEWHRLLDEGVK
jgi:hypothetical protein